MGNRAQTVESVALDDDDRKHRARKTIVRWLYGIGGSALLLWVISLLGHFAFNGTSSIPGSVYFLVKAQKPERDQLAAFYPPPGHRYPERMWFGKYIVGMPGDEVTIKGREFYINGRFLGVAKPVSSDGIPLTMSAAGIIPAGHYFMWTSHADSYDSRYADINWIPENRVLGRMYRIF